MRSRKSFHARGELPPPPSRLEHVTLRQLDGRSAATPKGRPLAAGQLGVVAQVDLGVETAGQHPVVLADQLVVDPCILQPQARKLAMYESFFASSRAVRYRSA